MHNIVFITASSKKEARRIAEALVKQKLAACVNIIGGVESLFWWQGKVDRAKEVLLVAKSTKKALPKLIRQAKALHSYTCPEIIALPIIAGEKSYLNWIDAAVS
ncbi:MAG: divalent-cation tolerance protein CutA [Candidatus Omnitrophota bacterium]|nr:divalent-cation tolerance protein CutA [Candidatus Omnitrophota bacterium]